MVTLWPASGLRRGAARPGFCAGAGACSSALDRASSRRPRRPGLRQIRYPTTSSTPIRIRRSRRARRDPGRVGGLVIRPPGRGGAGRRDAREARRRWRGRRGRRIGVGAREADAVGHRGESVPFVALDMLEVADRDPGLAGDVVEATCPFSSRARPAARRSRRTPPSPSPSSCSDTIPLFQPRTREQLMAAAHDVNRRPGLPRPRRGLSRSRPCASPPRR